MRGQFEIDADRGQGARIDPVKALHTMSLVDLLLIVTFPL